MADQTPSTTPDDLIDLFGQAMTALHRPVYAEMRRTGTPLYIGATPEDPDRGMGSTMNPNTRGLNIDDKMRLLESGYHNNIGGAGMRFLGGSIPDPKTAVYLHPDPDNPREAMAALHHEAIHDTLNKAGVTDDDYASLMKSGDPSITKLRTQMLLDHPNYKHASDAVIGSELPAYLGANHSDMFSAPDELRNLGLKVIQSHLDRTAGGAKYRTMVKDYNK